VNHIMLDVIFRSPKLASPVFSSALVLPKYRVLIDGVNQDYILNPLVQAYQICKTLNPKQLKTLKRAVHCNNKIRELCDGTIDPVKYGEIENINSNLKTALKTFCDYLYDESIKKAPFYHAYELIGDYYKKLVGRSSYCRCCGLNKILTKFHSKRSGLDHYLSLNHYPFSSINFKNLVPICDICNEKYKLGEDTLCKTENKGKRNEKRYRVKAFYPFRRTSLDIDISITFIKLKSIKNIEPENIDIEVNCTGYDEEVESWDRMFGIKENYKAECCTDEMLSYYEEQYMAEMINGKTHTEYIALLKCNKYGDANFLKIPFLNAISA
jgi:hypothetical protein